MDIDNMNDLEKSVLLARAMGWYWGADGRFNVGWWSDGVLVFGEAKDALNLYDPANMALAWRVLNWAHRVGFGGSTWLELNDWFKIESYDNKNHLHLWGQAPADAQRAWLDKVLELAIEAEMVEISQEKAE